MAAVAASVALAVAAPLPWLTEPLDGMMLVAGAFVMLAAIALIVTALFAMRRAKTTMSPTATATVLVVKGPFAVSRNPIYLGNALFMIGLGLVCGIVWFIVLAVVAGFLTQKLAIEPEERHLEMRFGKKYRDYCKRIRRWL